jgi:hypothetical protein
MAKARDFSGFSLVPEAFSNLRMAFSTIEISEAVVSCGYVTFSFPLTDSDTRFE